ncbi:MAG TPA: phosphodiester glycosidase family protein [Fimbriimonas sp.]|nr:phosphodiester glycosidase family protein [Fimbriimonas sp.]
MQLKFIALFGITVAFSQAPADQVWEKPVAPGLMYRMELQQYPPRLIHSLRYITSSPVISMSPELGGKTVFDSKGDGRRKVLDIAKENGALAAINGDFFNQGDPLGLMVRQGQLLSLPYNRRSILAWGPNSSVFGTARFSGVVTRERGRDIEINAMNQECPENSVTLNSPEAGLSRSKDPCLTLVLRVDGNRIFPTTTVSASVVGTTTSGANMPLQPGTYTLVAHGTKINELSDLKPGSEIKLKINTSGFDWEKLENAIGGGPTLLRNGNVSVDGTAQGFNIAFTDQRHPRTAVGRTTEGDLIFAVVDGRQKVSVGATLPEMAEIMKSLGCLDAINLDGGGSSAMAILGVGVTRPSDPGGNRPVANGLVFFGPQILQPEPGLKLSAMDSMGVGSSVQARVTDALGKEVNNVEVIWSVSGEAAWIDQGGQLVALAKGTATLNAYVRGNVLTKKIVVK